MVVQIFLVGRGYVVPTLGEVWRMRALPGWQRAAEFVVGEDFAGYLVFLRSHIPEDGRVILPPSQLQIPLAHVGAMQYFLFPRDIHNCGFDEVEACVLRAVGPKTFILALPGFPPREVASQVKDYVPYRDDLGVFVPR